MDKLIDNIENMKLIKELPAENLQEMIDRGIFILIDYEMDNIIHLENEKCEYLEIILKGKARVEHLNKNGETMSIIDFKTGDILGGNLIFGKVPKYPMLITAKEKTEMVLISKDNLFDLLMDYPKFLLAFLEYMSDHSSILAYTIKRKVNSTIRESVINYLTYEREKTGSDIIKLEFTKKDFAEQIGVQRTSLSRELNKMKKEGLIDYYKNTIVIMDKNM